VNARATEIDLNETNGLDSNGGQVVLLSKPRVGCTDVEVGPDGRQAPTQQPQLYGKLA
jgi:hypothetical protein